MGFLNAMEGLATGQGQASTATNTNTSVMPALLQTLDEHPGGLSGVLQHFQNNGMGDQVQQWSTGEQTVAAPGQIQQGLGGSGFIEKVAARAGVSPQVAEEAMAVVLPMVISHFTQGGQQPAPQGIGGTGFGGMATTLLGKLL
jgi:uncharacterized protein YidB (DUF937 family)